MSKSNQEKMCCICGKKKATNIPLNGKPMYINMGACDKPACVLERMRQVG